MRTWRGGGSFRVGKAFLVRLRLNTPDQLDLIRNLHSLCMAGALRWIPWRPPFVGVFYLSEWGGGEGEWEKCADQYIGLIF
jgi:hypothetical protein